MLVYRIGKSKWATRLDGEGARLYGGRWNHIGVPCVYASESRALAVLEYTVNTNIEEIPRQLSITTIEIADDFFDHPVSSLPGDWQSSPAPQSTKDFGTAFLQKAKHSVHRVPSIIIPQEYNFILNLFHEKSLKFRVKDVKDFVYDVRIKM